MANYMNWLRNLAGRIAPTPVSRPPAPPVKVVLIGNCQAGAISCLLPMLLPRIQVLAVVPIDDTPDNVYETYAAALDEADYVVTQSIKDNYPVAWVARSRLTELCGGKLMVFTNHFFDGYYPELCYMHDPEGKRHVLPGPMQTYHYKTVIHAYQQGIDVAGAIALCDDDGFYAERFDRVAERSLAELARREAAVDVRVGDYIAEHYRERRLFLTFNHPTTHLLLRSCIQILGLIGLAPEVDPDTVDPGEYLKVVAKPVAGPVYRAEGMRFDNDMPHQGWDIAPEDGEWKIGGKRDYSTAELVETFYRLYDDNRERILNYPINYNVLMS